MSKFKISLKLQSLEVSIEGEREDIPAISKSLTQQLTGLIAPAVAVAITDQQPSTLVDRAEPQRNPPTPLQLLEEIKRKPVKARRTTKRPPVHAGPIAMAAVDWRHDPEKYGTPQQAWNTADKSIWLLHVVNAETASKELPAKSIADTFNKHFRQAGTIMRHNVSRDLGKLKTKSGGPSPVAEDTTQEPPAWYLTEAGGRAAQALVAKALGRTE